MLAHLLLRSFSDQIIISTVNDKNPSISFWKPSVVLKVINNLTYLDLNYQVVYIWLFGILLVILMVKFEIDFEVDSNSFFEYLSGIKNTSFGFQISC